MTSFPIWVLVLGNIALALTANALSTLWALRNGQDLVLLAVVVVISPIIFLSFGMVSSRVGLAVGSAWIDSALTISSVLLGMILLGGWRDVSLVQYGGIGLALAGIILMQFGKS